MGEKRMPHAATQNGHEERPLGCGRLSKGVEVRGVIEEFPWCRSPTPLDRSPDVPVSEFITTPFGEDLHRHNICFCRPTVYNALCS